MPLFEYRCMSCRYEFEVLVREDHDVPHACPSCGTQRPERRFSTFSAVSGSLNQAPCGGNPQNCESGACPYS